MRIGFSHKGQEKQESGRSEVIGATKDRSNRRSRRTVFSHKEQERQEK